MEEQVKGMERREMEEENKKLRKDNEMLNKIVVQLKMTIDRMVDQYITEEPKR